jgi:hypothetical protein
LLEPLDRSPGPLLVSAASGSLVESAPSATMRKSAEPGRRCWCSVQSNSRGIA